jgi:hypothetical protein
MSEMIERVARALCQADGHDPDGPTCDIFVPGDPDAGLPWAGYRKQARAAIEAMRDLGDNPGPRYTAGEYSRRNIEALIADALTAPPQP